jgi:hypothetical protein
LIFILFIADSNKEQLRFNKNKMLIGGHPEEVSLRPSANSMMFKQTNINLNLPLNNGKHFLNYYRAKDEITKKFIEIR